MMSDFTGAQLIDTVFRPSFGAHSASVVHILFNYLPLFPYMLHRPVIQILTYNRCQGLGW